jgi:hypothetical protein
VSGASAGGAGLGVLSVVRWTPRGLGRYLGLSCEGAAARESRKPSCTGGAGSGRAEAWWRTDEDSSWVSVLGRRASGLARAAATRGPGKATSRSVGGKRHDPGNKGSGSEQLRVGGERAGWERFGDGQDGGGQQQWRG